MMNDVEENSVNDSEDEGSPTKTFAALEKSINKQEGGPRKFTKISS